MTRMRKPAQEEAMKQVAGAAGFSNPFLYRAPVGTYLFFGGSSVNPFCKHQRGHAPMCVSEVILNPFLLTIKTNSHNPHPSASVIRKPTLIPASMVCFFQDQTELTLHGAVCLVSSPWPLRHMLLRVSEVYPLRS